MNEALNDLEAMADALSEDDRAMAKHWSIRVGTLAALLVCKGVFTKKEYTEAIKELTPVIGAAFDAKQDGEID